jgi:hypothetical protein
MKTFACILFAVAAVTAAWSAGLAQARVADFEIRIDAPAGEMRVVCSKGCDWGATGAGVAVNSMTYRCERQPCQLLLNGRGRINVGLPVVPTVR